MTAGIITGATHWIAGRRVDGDGAWIKVINPATEEIVATVPAGTVANVDAAVAAARDAFAAWSATSVEERVAAVRGIIDGLAARRRNIASIITAEMGAPIRFASKEQVSSSLAIAKAMMTLTTDFPWTERIDNALVVREPVGVVGLITPWNYPLEMVLTKLMPALMAGCTVVLKPSEIAPLTAGIVAEIVADTGLPDGVFNLVYGDGRTVGAALAAHPDVDMISFTGSTRVGQVISAAAAATIKRVVLELGGKSANVILDDADLAAAVKIGLSHCFSNGGQCCTAWSRMLVPASRHDEIIELAVAETANYTVGDPTDPLTWIGPMASAAQRDRVRSYIRRGIADSATLATGGPDTPVGLNRGYYVRPTVFAGVAPDTVIAQEEIFGPVLAVIPYRHEDEAVSIANATIYGLAGAVFSADVDRALAVARRLRSGQVAINGATFSVLTPFGGYRQSGNGREQGRYGLEEFCELKSIHR